MVSLVVVAKVHDWNGFTGKMFTEEAYSMPKELLEKLENLQARLHEMRVSL